MAQQSRNFFFTTVPAADRFLSGNEPTEQIMRDFLDSIAFKREVSDTATNMNQGLVETATQAEFNAGTDNDIATGFSLYVRPSMIKTALDNITIFFNAAITLIQADITAIYAIITTINANITALTTTVNNLTTSVGESMPIGSIITFPSTSAPNAKWLQCNGISVPTASYPDLFAIIGYSFGGAGAVFALPNTQHKFIGGYDAGDPDFNAVGFVGGANSQSLTAAQLPTHKHTVNTAFTDGGQVVVANGGSHVHNTNISTPGASGINLFEVTSDVGDGNIPTAAAGDHTHSLSGDTGDGSSLGLTGAPFDNKPQYIVMPQYIKVLI